MTDYTKIEKKYLGVINKRDSVIMTVNKTRSSTVKKKKKGSSTVNEMMIKVFASRCPIELYGWSYSMTQSKWKEGPWVISFPMTKNNGLEVLQWQRFFFTTKDPRTKSGCHWSPSHLKMNWAMTPVSAVCGCHSGTQYVTLLQLLPLQGHVMKSVPAGCYLWRCLYHSNIRLLGGRSGGGS